MVTQNMILSLTNYHEQTGYKANIVFKHSHESHFGFNLNQTLLCSIVDKALRLIDTETTSNRWTRKTLNYSSKLARQLTPWLIGAFGTALYPATPAGYVSENTPSRKTP
ncbi:MAG: hypothetical protein LBJ41_03120 [Treponema sp.]|nr:hypothetical protein [Treponema sp.]